MNYIYCPLRFLKDIYNNVQGALMQLRGNGSFNSDYGFLMKGWRYESPHIIKFAIT